MLRLQANSLRSRIARRIFGVFVLCAFIPFAGLVLVSYRQVSDFFHEKNQRQLRALAKTFGMDTYERLLLLEAALQIIAGTIKNSGTIPSEERLEALPSNPKARWNALAVITAEGKRHRLLGEVEEFPNLGSGEKSHLDSGKALLLIRPHGADSSTAFMILAVDPQQQEKGILIGEIKPSYLWNITESRVLPPYIKPCVLEMTGVTLMCPSPEDRLAAMLLHNIGGSALGEFEWTENGTPYQASYWTIPIKFEFQTSEWIMVLLTSKEGIFASISDLKYTFVLWTLLCLGLSLLLALFQIRRRLVPVEKLHEATQRIAQKDFDSRVEIQSTDEFRQLAGAFNNMAAQLGHQFNTLNITADIQRAVLSVLDTTRIAETILRRMMVVLRCDGATLTLFGATRDDAELSYVLCRTAPENGMPESDGDCLVDGQIDHASLVQLTPWKEGGVIARRAAGTSSPFAIDDLSADAQLKDSEWLNIHKFTSCLAAPLIVNGRSFGAIAFYASGAREFTEKDRTFVSGLTSEAAIAVYNSQLYERTTRQAAELTVANRVKDEFLAVVSHELRTPISVILGYITLLQDQLLGAVTAEQGRALATMTTQSRDLLAMIERIIDVTNLESGNVAVENNEVNLPQLIGEVRSHYNAPQDKQIELVWDCPPGLPVLTTDAAKLKRIMHNLIDNAIKFTEVGRVIVTVQWAAENGSLIIEVADSGVGIAEHDLPMLFKKFRQVDGSPTRRHEGIGLGLYIVKRLSDLIGAQIDVRSRLGAGTTFTLSFSVAAPHPPDSPPCDGHPRKPAGDAFRV